MKILVTGVNGQLGHDVMNVKCFFGTFFKVFKTDGVVEGGTEELAKEKTKQ